MLSLRTFIRAIPVYGAPELFNQVVIKMYDTSGETSSSSLTKKL